jgi:GNAT superfamily N-acetyltransferase
LADILLPASPAAPIFHIREATFADREVIAHHRVSMFAEMGTLQLGNAADLRDATMAYLADAIPSGEYRGWLAALAAAPARIVAGCGVHVRNIAPFPMESDGTETPIAAGRQAMVVNVFTEPDYRRQGLARALMRTVLDWAKIHGFDSVVLHTTPAGRSLYESLGFVASNEMRLRDLP